MRGIVGYTCPSCGREIHYFPCPQCGCGGKILACLLALVLVLGCSGTVVGNAAEGDWHCFEFEGSDFGCVCEEGEPAFEPTGTCAPTGCCFEYVAFNDVGEGSNACRCVPEEASACEGIVAPYEGNIVASCPG